MLEVGGDEEEQLAWVMEMQRQGGWAQRLMGVIWRIWRWQLGCHWQIEDSNIIHQKKMRSYVGCKNIVQVILRVRDIVQVIQNLGTLYRSYRLSGTLSRLYRSYRLL